MGGFLTADEGEGVPQASIASWDRPSAPGSLGAVHCLLYSTSLSRSLVRRVHLRQHTLFWKDLHKNGEFYNLCNSKGDRKDSLALENRPRAT